MYILIVCNTAIVPWSAMGRCPPQVIDPQDIHLIIWELDFCAKQYCKYLAGKLQCPSQENANYILASGIKLIINK